MDKIVNAIAEFRILVGFLGEKSQFNWWDSDFFGQSAALFLAPIFNRSILLAQYHGVTAAAARLHDETIGVGRIYHLFRLPIELEQSAAELLATEDFADSLKDALASKESALSRLSDIAAEDIALAEGPVLIGTMVEEMSVLIQRAAAHYRSAFMADTKSFPYAREVE